MKTIKLLFLLLLIPIIGQAQTYILDNAETLLEYRYEDFIRNDTLEAYIVYSNTDEPWNPYTCDNAYVVIAQMMIAGEEVSILFKAYDRERDVFIPFNKVLYYEIKI